MIEGEKKHEQPKNESLFPCVAIGSERTKFEQFKADSSYLLEPLAAALQNTSDHFTNDAVKLLKFHGSYHQDNRDNRKKGETEEERKVLKDLINEQTHKLIIEISEQTAKLATQIKNQAANHAAEIESLKNMITRGEPS